MKICGIYQGRWSSVPEANADSAALGNAESMTDRISAVEQDLEGGPTAPAAAAAAVLQGSPQSPERKQSEV